MRKLVSLILIAIMLFSTVAYAEETTDITVEIDGKLVTFENPPTIVSGRTTAPLRAVFESLGLEVGWNPVDRSITGKAPGVSIWLQLDNDVAVVNGKEVKLDVPAFVIEGRTYVPVRFISEATGAEVGWDGVKRRVMITSKPVDLRLVDTDKDGLSDYHELHKYMTDPNKVDTDGDGISDGDWNERKENVYTITAKMQVMKPFNSDQMTDDYQDIKVISETATTLVFEAVIYPFNTNHQTITANANWLNDYKDMEELKPTLTANWDEALRTQIITDLKKDGIDYYSLKSDKEVVEAVAPWIWKTSQFANGGPTDFLVDFDNGIPKVNPVLKSSSLWNEYTQGAWTEEMVINHLVMGKTMYEKKVHGSCSSSSTYQTTILRALGIPTRITFQVPLYNGEMSDERALLKNLDNAEVRTALEKMFNGIGDHFYNEVYVGNQWVRLNYEKMGANIYDPTNPMAILVNLGVENDFSAFDMAGTWATYIVDNRNLNNQERKDFLKLISIED
ncbi:MAG: hypothetical protein JXR88_14575 [Clostridia bacterium]|nr:hypothetical protein [Clostridia bacterium]